MKRYLFAAVVSTVLVGSVQTVSAGLAVEDFSYPSTWSGASLVTRWRFRLCRGLGGERE